MPSSQWIHLGRLGEPACACPVGLPNEGGLVEDGYTSITAPGGAEVSPGTTTTALLTVTFVGIAETVSTSVAVFVSPGRNRMRRVGNASVAIGNGSKRSNVPCPPLANAMKPHGSNSRRCRTCRRSRKALNRNSFPGAPERIRTSDLRFRNRYGVELRGPQCVLGTRNLAKRGKPCPGWFVGKLQKK